MTDFVPGEGKVLLKQVEDSSVSSGGVHLVSTDKESLSKGIVLKQGEGILLKDGVSRKAHFVQSNDEVYFLKYAAIKLKLDGEEYLVLKEEDILGKVPAKS